jgi:hypothetical protein
VQTSTPTGKHKNARPTKFLGPPVSLQKKGFDSHEVSLWPKQQKVEPSYAVAKADRRPLVAELCFRDELLDNWETGVHDL